MNKTVLITGASSGIGKASARYFQQQGWNIAATMRKPEKETELSALPHVKCLHLDVTDEESIRQAVNETLQHFGGIDVVVNNAGFAVVGPFEAATAEEVRKQFETNVFGLMNVTRAVLPYFRNKKAGLFVNVASMGGRLTFPLYSLYHSTKWAVEGFTESLQYELREFNIRLKIIEPGAIRTDFYDRSQDLVQKEGLTAYDNYIQKAYPYLHKAGEVAPGPEIVARKIYRAATDRSWKLRYPVGSSAPMYLFLRRLLPDSWYSRVVRTMVEH